MRENERNTYTCGWSMAVEGHCFQAMGYGTEQYTCTGSLLLQDVVNKSTFSLLNTKGSSNTLVIRDHLVAITSCDNLRGQVLEKSTFFKELTSRLQTYELRCQGEEKKKH